jgi:hypothetical protein
VFAPLSHMLMKGFFFNQGLDIACASNKAPCSARPALRAVGPEGLAA